MLAVMVLALLAAPQPTEPQPAPEGAMVKLNDRYAFRIPPLWVGQPSIGGPFQLTSPNIAGIIIANSEAATSLEDLRKSMDTPFPAPGGLFRPVFVDQRGDELWVEYEATGSDGGFGLARVRWVNGHAYGFLAFGPRRSRIALMDALDKLMRSLRISK